MPEQRALAPPQQPAPRRSAAARMDAWRRRFFDAGPLDVSVCVANWNCREVLRGCLESLLDRPQGVRLEVIVVDNGSTDGAPEMVEREFPEVVLFRNASNAGFSRANNRAARAARGRYFLFLNNDTVVPPGGLRRLVEYADAHPDVGLVGPRLRDGAGQTQVSYRLRPTMATLLHRTAVLRWTGLLRSTYQRYRRDDFDPETTRPVEILMGAAMLLPREAFAAAGGWDEEFAFGGEDLDLSIRVGRRYRVVYHPAVEVLHYGRVSSRQHIGYVSAQMAVGFLRYLRKSGYSRPALWFYKSVVTLDAPVQVVGKAGQYLWRRLCGRRTKADKSLLAMRGFAHFLRHGLAEFWRS
jgi:N-acetylglucosaminyl-diphospho-decaprenol L-rhamnosyltransferase